MVIRNYAAGSFTKRFSISHGKKLKNPILEFYYKSDKLNDPFMNDAHIYYLKIANVKELKKIKSLIEKLRNFFWYQ